jgi:hypothetical protein
MRVKKVGEENIALLQNYNSSVVPLTDSRKN